MTHIDFPLMAAWYLVFVFSTTVHEAAHALASYKMGDPTAYHGGQVSLDPRPHMKREPLGMIVVPLLSFISSGGWMIGWASAPYDPVWAMRYPRRSAWMAAAGPFSNLLLMLIAFVIIRICGTAGIFEAPARINFSHMADASGVWEGVALVVSIMFSLNLVLFVFNLLPLPPMDGSSAVTLLMSESAARSWEQTIRQPQFAFVGLFAAWWGFSYIFEPIFLAVVNLLYPDASYG